MSVLTKSGEASQKKKKEFKFILSATQPHPDVKPMAYANSFMSMFGFM